MPGSSKPIQMRLFWELTRRAFQRHLTYRAAALAGLATNFFFGLIRVSVFTALYGARQEVSGITLEGVITYTGLTQAVIAYLSLFSWNDLMDSIYTGDVASDLLKPMNFFSFWLAQDIGRAVVALLLRGVIFMLLFELAFDLTYPRGPAGWAAFAASLALGLLISFAWRFLISLAAFWTPSARGFARFAFLLAWFFSGFMMPLRFFPDWVVRLSFLTPFPHMINTVVEIYLGVLPAPDLIAALLAQLLWVLGLFALGQLVLQAGVRRLVILGG